MDLFVNKKDRGKNLSSSINVTTSNLDSINSMNPNMISNHNSDNNRKLYHSTSVNFGYDTSTTRHRPTKLTNPSFGRQNSFIHNSINSSLDFPTYIPWQSLSTEVNENLKSGALRINKRLSIIKLLR